MSTKAVTQSNSVKVAPLAAKKDSASELPQPYDGDAMEFAGNADALYDRHLIFDRAIDPKAASARERFEAFAHSVRDVLAQRWVKTKSTYEQQNAKRIYYLSM